MTRTPSGRRERTASHGRRGTLAAILALGAACGPAEPPPDTLGLLQATPEAGATGVFLNERVQLFFSERLDPASVHAHSARVVAGDGLLARGRWLVQGERLTFLPEPVLSRDLSDGGYRPGQRYRVELVGFPRPDGLRGESGAPLARTARWEFSVVEVREPRRGFVFEDSSLEEGRPLFLSTPVVAIGQPIRLEGEEPLDPSTLHDDDFVLTRGRATGRRGERIGVRALLVANFDKYAPGSRGTTLIELVPERRLDTGAGYELQLASDARLRDFGGHPVPLLSPTRGRRCWIEVREPSGPLRDVHFEAFMDAGNRSLEAVPGADGTAWWGDSGRVEVRFPAAAGRGSDGDLSLAGDEPRRDVQALRLLVPSGKVLRLTSQPGLVVLRAQGSLRIEGRLERRAGGGSIDPDPGATLSGWLEQLAAAGGGALASEADGELRGGATVLVAGGDLVVNGRLSVDGPLVLVAGGRIRIGSREQLEATEGWYLGEGGSGLSYINPHNGTPFPVQFADLVQDAPLDNPLAGSLIFAVRSGPIPRQGRARRWHALPRVGGYRRGNGSFRVRYVGERVDRAPGEPAEVIAEDPVLLSDCPVLRLLVELEVHPGEAWDPPWVDFVELSWEPADAERVR